MLGNDIVDLADPETRSGGQHPRFDERVFAQSERAVLARNSDPTRMRWILWAVKESAYKALRRMRPGTVFSPPRFVVDLDPQLDGTVTVGNEYCRAHVEIDGACVHAIATVDSTRAWTLWGSQRISHPSIRSSRDNAAVDGNASQRARELALEQIASRLEINRSELDIERSGRIPHLLHRGARTTATLSLAHHGSHVGFACRFPIPSVDVRDERIKREPLEGTTH